MKVRGERGYRAIFIVLLSVVLSVGYLCYAGAAQVARADGGAPNLAYVSGVSAGVGVIDVAGAKVTRTLAIGGDPHMILLSQDGRFLYVTQPAQEQVSVILARTGRTVCSAHLQGEPSLLAYDAANGFLYTAGDGASTVSLLDAANCRVRHTYQTNSPVYGLALAGPEFGLPDGTTMQLWVAGTAALTIFDVHSGQIIDRIAVAGGPQYLSAPPGVMMYMTTRQGSVDAVNFQNRSVHQLLTNGQFGPMDYDALTGEVYVPDQQSSSLEVLAPVDPTQATVPKEPERTITMGAPPEAVAITNDGLIGFVALRGGKVAMLDLLGRRLDYTVTVGGSPHFIITGLYPPAQDVSPASSSSSPAPAATAPPPFWARFPGWLVITIVVVYTLLLIGLVVVFVRLVRGGVRARGKR